MQDLKTDSHIIVNIVRLAGCRSHTRNLCIHDTHNLTWLLLTNIDLDQVRVHPKSTPTNGDDLATKNGAMNGGIKHH